MSKPKKKKPQEMITTLSRGWSHTTPTSLDEAEQLIRETMKNGFTSVSVPGVLLFLIMEIKRLQEQKQDVILEGK